MPSQAPSAAPPPRSPGSSRGPAVRSPEPGLSRRERWTMPQPTQRDFERLLEFRVTLRRFQRWSEDQAQAAGLSQVQHQLLVAIKGHRGEMSPTMGELAGDLLLRPHSTVELVDRAVAAGLVERMPDSVDGRVVRVRLTGEGDRV